MTRAEVLALTLALTEYLYLVEEGAARELLDEMETDSNDVPLTAGEAMELRARLQALL